VKEIPMLIRIIKEATKLNPKKIIIISGKYDSLIKLTIESYGDIYNKLFFVKKNNPKRTADAIKSTLEYSEDNEDILILNRDMPLITSDLMSKFTKDFKEAKLLVAKLENPFRYGRIIYNEKGDFTSIIEDKDCSLE
jgi:bifunctional UDP-N-acetylglucosamine pyrophosphorylase/glucosamine-1-phosphate N-acetyltransferase